MKREEHIFITEGTEEPDSFVIIIPAGILIK